MDGERRLLVDEYFSFFRDAGTVAGKHWHSRERRIADFDARAIKILLQPNIELVQPPQLQLGHALLLVLDIPAGSEFVGRSHSAPLIVVLALRPKGSRLLLSCPRGQGGRAAEIRHQPDAVKSCSSNRWGKKQRNNVGVDDCRRLKRAAMAKVR